MKRILALIMFVALLASNLNAQQKVINEYDIKMVTFDDGKQYVHMNGRRNSPVDGAVRITKGYTTEYIDAQLKGGYPFGEWIYYKDEKVIQISNYKDGFPHGAHIFYNDNGSDKLKSTYRDGKKEGAWLYYNYEGKIERVEEYENNEMGKRVTYHANGKVESDREYKAGKENGISKHFSDDGQLRAEFNFKMGQKIGNQLSLHKSNRGDYVETCNYNNDGQLDGDFAEIYIKNKNTRTKGSYRNGRKDGKWIYAHPATEQIFKEETFKNGKLVHSMRY